MPLSPDEAVDPSEAAAYQQAQDTMNRLMYEGASWSGNERNCFYLNTGDNRFANISMASGVDFLEDGRGVAVVDWDHDGDLDLWMSSRTAPRIRFMRNEIAEDHHFLAIRIEGRECNRDAIGARVEVVLSDQGSERAATDPGGRRSKRIKTLRAGEGFLSQSSKWLHFGLGAAAKIERLVVRWPGGEAEQFTALEADRHYRIVQGSGAAEVWDPPRQSVRLAASVPKLPEPTERKRHLLAARYPIPESAFESFDGRLRALGEMKGKPLLINLWASWCMPCVKELEDLGQHQQKLRAAGLEVAALSVDGLGDQGTTVQDARDLIQKLDFPFISGRIYTEMLASLQRASNDLYVMERPLPIPTSFLLDAQGELAAVYVGPVDLDELVRDVDRLELEGPLLRSASRPFPGRWDKEPPLRSDVYFSLALAAHFVGKKELAAAYYRRVLDFDPNDAASHNNLGALASDAGRLDEARLHYERALTIDPEDAEAHHNLGLLFARQRQFKQAIEHYRRALTIKADYAQVHVDLGNLYVAQDKLLDAATAYRRALVTAPDHVEARHNLKAVEEALGK